MGRPTSTRAALLVGAAAAAAALGGCYDPHLGAVPFTCSDGACPSGYRCVRDLCLGPTTPDPPLLFAVTDENAAPPRPLWDGSRFLVVAQQNDPAQGATGLLLFRENDPSYGRQLSPWSGDVAFDAVWVPQAGRVAAVVRRNNDAGLDRLALVSQAEDDAQPRVHLSCAVDRSAFGYSAPSLALAGGSSVTGAWTRVVTPTIEWTTVDVSRGGLPLCTPRRTATPGHPYAVEAAVAVVRDITVLFFRDTEVSTIAVVAGIEGAPSPLGAILRVVRAVTLGDTVAVVAQHDTLVGLSAPPWFVAVNQVPAGRGGREQPIPSLEVIPDAATDGSRFLVCARGADGELALYRVRADGSAIDGPPIPVPRLSKAPIRSCRIAAAPAPRSTVAVAWQELLPPATVRQYLTLVPVP